MSDQGETAAADVWADPELVEGILQTSPVGITVVDADGTVAFANERAEEIYGRSREEIGEFAHDDSRWDLVDEDGQPFEPGEAPFDRVVDGAEPIYDEVVGLRRPSGERVWLSVNGAPQWDDGALERAVFAFEDVTEREERERERREEQRRYRAIFEDPNILVGLLEPDGTVVDINQTAMEYVDADLDDVTGEPFWETPWWGEGDGIQPEVKEWTERAADGEYVDFEADLTRPDGEQYTLSGYFRPVTDDDGEVVSIIVSDRDVSERKQRERELEESERRYRTLVEHFPNGAVALVDEELRYQTVGGDTVEVAGAAADDIEEQPVTEAVPPELADELVPRYEAALEGESSTFEVELDDRIYQFQVVPVTDDDGDVFAALGMSQDVTERKEHERALEESERRYRTLVDNFPDGSVGLFDEEFTYTVVGGELLDELGLAAEDVVDTTIYARYPDEFLDEIRPYFEAVFDGESNTFEIDVTDRDLLAHTLPVRDADDEIYAGMLLVQDVTERRRRERELERALDLLNKAERIADVAGWEVDPETQEVFWSDHLFELLDVDYEEQPTIEQALDVYYSEADRQVVEDAVDDALESGESFEVVARFPRPQGDVGRLKVQGAPEVEDGEVVSLRGAVQDVTEQVEREERLEELVAQLEESNERLEQFAYAASHDLQEPLRMVSSYLQLIERRYAGQLDEDGREFIEFAVDGADRMRDMIEALLEYSRVETQGDPFEPVDLDDVLADVRDDLQVMIEERDADLAVEDLPRVEGDGSQLRQVFQNLLENALEYSGDEPPRVRVSAEPLDGGSEWRLAVADEGVGIDPDDQERVFEVFQRLHGRDEREGTGIGLALCERIVERHGSELRVDSEPGEGATFWFTLPAAAE